MSEPAEALASTLERALADHRGGRLAEAETGYRAVLAADPANPKALCYLGMIAAQIGRSDAAIQLIESAIRTAPDLAEAHNNLGALHASAGRDDLAEACFRRAIDAEAGNFEGLRNLGTILVGTGRPAEALAYFERAIAVAPLPQEINLNYALALAAHNRFDEAEAILRDLLFALPDNPSPATNLGTVLQAQGRLDEAIASFREAVRRAPDSGDTHYNLSIALLLAGRMEEGWKEHEWRRYKKRTELASRRYSAPLWYGQPIDGSLLIYSEQGLGDVIQFARFLPMAATRSRHLTFECVPRLHRLLRTMRDRGKIDIRATAPQIFDAHAASMSLPHLLAIDLDESKELAQPYLSAEPTLIAQWRQRLGPKNGLRIGIAWQGNPNFPADKQRSLPLRHFTALAAVPGVQLYSLQKGTGTEQLAGFGAPIVDLGPELDVSDAFVDTAAVIASLDLVVTSDTSLAHLAGALGTPVWTLLSFVPDWRWLMAGESSAWYPSMRLFRQTRRDDWDSVLARVAKSLKALRP